jgi:hypothetical protein
MIRKPNAADGRSTYELHLNVGAVVLTRMNQEEFEKFVRWCNTMKELPLDQTYLFHFSRVEVPEEEQS